MDTSKIEAAMEKRHRKRDRWYAQARKTETPSPKIVAMLKAGSESGHEEPPEPTPVELRDPNDTEIIP